MNKYKLQKNELIQKPTNQPTSQTTNQPTNQPTSQPTEIYILALVNNKQ